MSIPARWGSGAFVALILASTNADALPPSRAAYVVGSNDASLARVDLDTQIVVPAIAALGSLANRIEVAGDLSYAAIANSGSDNVTIFDLESESVAGAIALPVGSNPWTIEIVGDRMFVTALANDTVFEMDRSSLAIVDSAPTGKAPEGMCVVTGRLWVANTGFDLDTFLYDPGTVSVFDLTDLSPVATVSVGINPQECLVAPDGRVHVICTGDFAGTAGTVHVIDPVTSTPVDTLGVAGYPGGGAVHAAGDVVLNVLTFSFGSEIWVYDAASLTWTHDGSDPLFETFHFLGNPRVTAGGQVLLPDFDGDLLVIEDLSGPGDPGAVLVGDGPIDSGVVERQDPVPILLSGLSAVAAGDGVRLSWRALTGTDVIEFVVDRKTPAHSAYERIASELPVRPETAWVDRGLRPDVPYTYRVGAVRASGAIRWSSSITFLRRPPSDERLAIRRAFPNPFRRRTSIEIELASAGRASLENPHVRERRITVIDAGPRPRGASTIIWDGRDAAGRVAAPGAYFARARVGGESAVTRVLRVR
jgi:hypothetical protein